MPVNPSLSADVSAVGVTLTVGNVQCSTWNEIEIDDEMLTPAAHWRLRVYNAPFDLLPPTMIAGADIAISYQGQAILTGVVDKRHQSVHHTEGRFIEFSGRDLVGQLIDCSVDIFNGTHLTLEQVVAKSLAGGSGADASSNATMPIHILIPDANTAVLADKTAVEPGEQVWTAIQKAAIAEGFYVWGDPDGALMIGNPVADEPQPAQVPRLVSMQSGGKSGLPRVISLDFEEDVAEVYSEIHVLGQGLGGQSFSVKRRNILNTHRTLKNDKAAAYNGGASQVLQRRRLRILVSGQAQNQTEANALADKALHDSNLNAYTLTVTVEGWQCATGEVWRKGWRVTVLTDAIADVSSTEGYWVVFGRTLKLSRHEGKTTVLKLKRIQDWMNPVKQQTPLHDAAWSKQQSAARKARRVATTKSAINQQINEGSQS